MDRLVQYRMAVIWSNLIHWLENKISILHINVWNMQIWSIDDLIVIKQNIKIGYAVPSGSDVHGWLLLPVHEVCQAVLQESEECGVLRHH